MSQQFEFTMGNKIKGKDLELIGFSNKQFISKVLGHIARYRKKEDKSEILQEAASFIKNPENYIEDGFWSKIAQELQSIKSIKSIELRKHIAPFSIFGEDFIDDSAKKQLYQSLQLPISVQGALMPDAHFGYGLPIGGVLATENAVIPFGVGVDIGCRMHLSIFELKADYFKGQEDKLIRTLQNHTCFGQKETHYQKQDHEVLHDSAFKEIGLLRKLKDKAYNQLGTSGSGNHFVEFGTVKLTDDNFGLEKGQYFALLTHSGSRGLGATIAGHFTQLAMENSGLPQEMKHLAWLDLNTNEGQEYWISMNLAGDYAKACHENIHQRIASVVQIKSAVSISNHHNFAWKEIHNNQEVIVHRKGATPAGLNDLGIIPGSMTEAGYIVRGKGNASSLHSASHGAGRLHSRTQCKNLFTSHQLKQVLKNANVQLIGGGLDEAPMAYKNIKQVIGAQSELIDVLGTFHPTIVRMDG